jgi:hypothetical protein
VARCRCLEGQCGCMVTAGHGIDVTGDGSTKSPWIVSTEGIAGVVSFVDTDEVDFTVGGAGTTLSPVTIEASLPLLTFTGGSTGWVLNQQADGTFAPGPPTTAPAGAVNPGFGISGDGSAGNPLRVNLCNYDQLKAACAP